MTNQEIQKLAGHREVPPWVMKLVGDAIAIEREACAKVCEDIEKLSEGSDDPPPYRYYEAIRARGQPQPKKDTTDAKWIAHCLAASTLPKEFRPKEFK